MAIRARILMSHGAPEWGESLLPLDGRVADPQVIQSEDENEEALAAGAGAELRYFTKILTPAWLLTPPMMIEMGLAPGSVVDGITTFACITPEIRPGASP